MIIQFENTMYDLTKLHTRQLLKLYKRIRFSYLYDYCYEFNWRDLIDEEKQETLSLLQEELATREHVPNKKEAKMIRKEKAVQQKNQKNKKYRNR